MATYRDEARQSLVRTSARMVRAHHSETARTRCGLFDQAAALRVSHRFESGVRAQLAIDVVQVVAERLRGDLQLAGDRGRIASLGEERENRFLLAGQELDWRLVGCLVVDRDHLPSRGQ